MNTKCNLSPSFRRDHLAEHVRGDIAAAGHRTIVTICTVIFPLMGLSSLENRSERPKICRPNSGNSGPKLSGEAGPRPSRCQEDLRTVSSLVPTALPMAWMLDQHWWVLWFSHRCRKLYTANSPGYSSGRTTPPCFTVPSIQATGRTIHKKVKEDQTEIPPAALGGRGIYGLIILKILHCHLHQ